MGGRFGIRLHGRADSALIDWLADQTLACIEVPAHWQPLRERCPGVRWQVRVECIDELEADADALVIAADTHLPLLLAALARRKPCGPKIGVSGLIGSPASAQAMFDMGWISWCAAACFCWAARPACPSSVSSSLPA
ncbi:hypothetical protein NWF32_16910 [Pseudomonas qingdaonensis]|nr:hypothetical protein [Pseudomonas qingdaonensis]